MKLAERGGAVVWGRDQYIREGLQQLTNPDFYLALTVHSYLPAAENKTWVGLVGNFRCGGCNHCDSGVKKKQKKLVLVCFLVKCLQVSL